MNASTRKNQRGCNRAAFSAYAYLTAPVSENGLGIPPNRIVLFGRSIGSGWAHRKNTRTFLFLLYELLILNPTICSINLFVSISRLSIHSSITCYRPTLHLASQPCVRDALAGVVLQSPIASGGKRSNSTCCEDSFAKITPSYLVLKCYFTYIPRGFFK